VLELYGEPKEVKMGTSWNPNHPKPLSLLQRLIDWAARHGGNLHHEGISHHGHAPFEMPPVEPPPSIFD
jgi:hypothetical protein